MKNIRRNRLERFYKEFNLDAILFSNLLNIRYLSGFTGSEGALLVTPEKSWLLCDSRYTTQAAAQVVDVEVRQFSVKKNVLAQLIEDENLARIGFESAHTTVAAHCEFSATLKGCELVAIGEDLDQIRCLKDSDELEQLGSVAELASEALQAVLGLIRPGVSELSVSRELEIEILRRGGQGKAFDFIVASGERGAMPHGKASDKIMAEGELVTIDFGAVLDGYYSDETVTVAIGEPDNRRKEIYSVVKEAHDRAIVAARPGISCRDLDAVARNYIRECGYGDYFGHGLGHGVGLEIHEQPTLSPRSDLMLQEGMVVTVEPGIYVPGFGGVRIEDTIRLTADGCRLLTKIPKDLMVL